MDFDKILATVAVIAGIIKTLTSAYKDIKDTQPKKKRRSPSKVKRRK